VPLYAELENRKTELIRKALEGSVFVAPVDADPIASLTAYTAGPPITRDLAALPEEWDDLGYLTEDGAAFARDVSQDETTSYGSATPTRTDVTSDVTALTVVCQETKLLTIGMATGADLAAAAPAAQTGEVRINKPTRPKGKHYRAMSLAVDLADGGEVYIARFLPRAKVSNYAEQSHNGGVVTWGVTLTGEVDGDLGYSESWIFGGPGWFAMLEDMGFDAPA